MSELISGKEALIALANGEDIEFNNPFQKTWVSITSLTIDEVLGGYYHCSDDNEKIKTSFRLKPRIITINGIEVPAPFEPKATDDCKCYHINTAFSSGFDWYHSSHHRDYRLVWQTEAEIKQVVAALRSVFKGGEK